MDSHGQLPSHGHRTRWKEPGGPHPAWAACLPLGCHETEEAVSVLLGPMCLGPMGDMGVTSPSNHYSNQLLTVPSHHN